MFDYCCNPLKKPKHKSHKTLSPLRSVSSKLAESAASIHFDCAAGMKICEGCQRQLRRMIKNPQLAEEYRAETQRKERENKKQKKQRKQQRAQALAAEQRAQFQQPAALETPRQSRVNELKLKQCRLMMPEMSKWNKSHLI